MADFSSLTIPTPEPYNKKHPNKQFENTCFVLLQLFELLKVDGHTITETVNVNVENVSLSLGGGVLEEIRDNIADLKFNGYTIKVGPLEITLHGQTQLLDISET